MPALPKRAAEDVPEEVKRKLFKKLDAKIELPMMAEPKWRPHLISEDGIGDIFYVPKWLEIRQAAELEQVIHKSCTWDNMSTRNTQEFGASDPCPCGRSLMQKALPAWQANIVMALNNLGVYHPVLYPANSVRINAYKPGQGIHPHADGPVYFPRAAIISLGAPCVFDFYPRGESQDDGVVPKWDKHKEVPAFPDLPPGTKPALSLVLQPGSLLVFSGDAFVHHRHGIKAADADEITPQVRNAKTMGLSVGDELEREHRISLTIRHLLPRCACSTMRP